MNRIRFLKQCFLWATNRLTFLHQVYKVSFHMLNISSLSFFKVCQVQLLWVSLPSILINSCNNSIPIGLVTWLLEGHQRCCHQTGDTHHKQNQHEGRAGTCKDENLLEHTGHMCILTHFAFSCMGPYYRYPHPQLQVQEKWYLKINQGKKMWKSQNLLGLLKNSNCGKS